VRIIDWGEPPPLLVVSGPDSIFGKMSAFSSSARIRALHMTGSSSGGTAKSSRSSPRTAFSMTQVVVEQRERLIEGARSENDLASLPGLPLREIDNRELGRTKLVQPGSIKSVRALLALFGG
jgi:hypothetical protein